MDIPPPPPGPLLRTQTSVSSTLLSTLFAKYAGSSADASMSADDFYDLFDELTLQDPTLMNKQQIDAFYEDVKGELEGPGSAQGGGLTLSRFKAAIGKVVMVEPPAAAAAAASSAAGPGAAVKTIEESTVVSRKLVSQVDCDDQGHLMASSTLKWIDLTALSCAWRHAQESAVTKAIDTITFLVPARKGEIVTLTGCLTRTFGSDMEIKVVITAGDPLAHGDEAHRHVCTAYSTFTALAFDLPSIVSAADPGSLNFKKAKIPELDQTAFGEPQRDEYAHAALRKADKRNRVKLQKTIVDAQPSEAGEEAKAGVAAEDDGGGGGGGGGAVAASSAARPVAASALSFTEVVLPQHANPYQTCFGGQQMSWMDLAARLAGQRHCALPCLTLSIDDVSFRGPVFLGELVTVKAQVTRVWRTSMEVLVQVYAENRWSGKAGAQLRCYSYFTLVGVDPASREPQALPALAVVTPQEKAYHELASARRKHRLQRAVRGVIMSPKS